MSLKIQPFPLFDAKRFLATLPNKSGVYRMQDATGTIIYVGKARNLKKRVSSYFTQSDQSPKTRALVAQIAQIEITITHTECEALLLEHTLIKTHQPRYNILLRDDKSYPYIYLSAHPFPQLGLHRGAKRGKGKYFGPYPHAKAVYESLNLMQKIFPIRQCDDSFFRNRSRPCLQYQIKRCSAPCVGLIDAQTYAEDVKHAVLFLEGKSHDVINTLVDKMKTAAEQLDYEKAAHYRDQINHLRTIQAQQYVSTDAGNVDIVACIVENGISCVQTLTVRDGRQLGSRAYFPKQEIGEDPASVLDAFLPQYYLSNTHDIPDEILIYPTLEDITTLAEAIKQQRQRHTRLSQNVRGTRARWIEMALENAKHSLQQHKPSHHRERLAALSIALHLETLPQRLECFDISHTQGEATVASCVVFDAEGICKNAYRRYNITGITGGDDYAAMQQALTRRFSKVQEEGILPDILFIDGGAGQVKIAHDLLISFNLTQVRIVGVAKGMGRKAGLESLIFPNEENPLILPKDSPALHLIQQIRDEAHRFAITGHRQQRHKARQKSVLEDIAGIGAKRRKQLLNHFGGLQGVSRAGVEELARVPGISRQLAQKIYEFFLTT
ncbi:excinuclease ABC, C subunit [Beggiatoa alba B18LD]|uniref:UvrABC system protein C n=1 Tax=Beggiatoa alba B18LD TaxID=395493 RepID=I3CEW1_9GAMM|nr:excinuclease ABC subunit UvrC [Beggiatoa alba]EIJ42154.1 excinuclease ABC, C subunit [Beggiatoa alba B18LD]